MHHHATHAQQRKPNSTVPKPRGSLIAIGGRRVGRSAEMRNRRAMAEGILIRMVGRFAVDAKGDASARAAHGHFVSGYITCLEASGVLPSDRLVVLKNVCELLLDTPLTLQDLKAMKASGNDTDPEYLRAVGLVRRSGQADADRLAGQMDTSTVSARRLIERMEADGIVQQPDLFGVRLVKPVEVSHG